jgi:Glycosyl hydrolase family 26
MITSVAFLFLTQVAFAQLLPPEQGAYQGAYADFGDMANEVSVERISEFEGLSGKKMVWAYFANDWLEGKIEFPQYNVDECIKAKVIPYIRLMPWSESKAQATEKDPLLSMDQFLNGDHDEALRQYALQAKDAGTQLMMEFGPEVNGYWFPWNGQWNGGGRKKNYGDPSWPDGPEKFRDVFRRIIDIFRKENVKNVTWVFHVDTAWLPRSEWNEAHYYYPGDDYIDWIGLSVFGAQLPNHSWSMFLPKFLSFEDQLNKISLTKPVLISEFGVIESRLSSSLKAIWLEEALKAVEMGHAKRVKGINYWNSSGWLPDRKASFRIDSSPEALESYRKNILSDFWLTEGIFNE